MLVDRRYVERAGNVTLHPQAGTDEMAMSGLRKFADAARGARRDVEVWVQLSHGGRQSNANVNVKPIGPSDKALQIGFAQSLMLAGNPREMTEGEIEGVVQRFATAARISKAAGFTGIQIHAAHGYLISSFLSPNVNARTDRFGGAHLYLDGDGHFPASGRALLLIEIFRRVRAEVGPAFPMGVKLNSSDFQKGGFSPEDSLQVALLLEREGCDLLELSGGTYERTAFLGDGRDSGGVKETKMTSTLQREAYFLQYTHAIKKAVDKV
jgi:2,4-dienoyl-CoA reductase-like NADH-dependent reductase (Old Yellow Enzyme family)